MEVSVWAPLLVMGPGTVYRLYPPLCGPVCIFLYRLVLFVSMSAIRLAGKTYFHDIFHVKGFPLERPDCRAIYCSGLLYVFQTCNIVNFLINFTLLTTTYLSKEQYSLFLLKVH